MSVQGTGQILDNAVNRGEQKITDASKEASAEVQGERIRSTGQQEGQRVAQEAQSDSGSYRLTISEQGRAMQKGEMLHPTPRMLR
ncbi:hypothetical protein [Magnetococcus sp. PR-3]|uniref:hypothetical protein n=1 Tax=Magnetococcus sp. PR-3 TaxID=3120355 RepID=UPI002FCE4596